jgi:hypothetical protein
LISFFEPQSTQLTDAQRKAWAKVFEQNVEFIVPDAKGRWAMLPKVSLKKGELRWPTNDLARFFEYSKITPSELAGLEKDFFGRVGDSV